MTLERQLWLAYVFACVTLHVYFALRGQTEASPSKGSTVSATHHVQTSTKQALKTLTLTLKLQTVFFGMPELDYTRFMPFGVADSQLGVSTKQH